METEDDLPGTGTTAQHKQLFESGGLVHEGRKLIEDEDVSERVYLCGRGGGGEKEEFACNGTKLIEDEDVSERVYLCGGGGGGGAERNLRVMGRS